MSIPNKVTSSDQIQNGFRKVNETIDNIVTGLTFISSSSTLSLSKLNGERLNVELPFSEVYGDYYYYSVFNHTFDVYYNYSDYPPVRDGLQGFSGFSGSTVPNPQILFTSITSSMTIPSNYNEPFYFDSGYYWKDGSFIGLGQGYHYFFLPTFPVEKKGYRITFNVTTPDYSGQSATNSYQLWVYQTQNGLDTEPSNLLLQINNTYYIQVTFIWTGTRWRYIGVSLNSSYSSGSLFG